MKICHAINESRSYVDKVCISKNVTVTKKVGRIDVIKIDFHRKCTWNISRLQNNKVYNDENDLTKILKTNMAQYSNNN